ncbi:MAG: hypothetical protein PHP44_11040 [Kiritimatiellae bacterium]|nr:hypothetical protein [Kiritimatiellia bacterium]MDD4736625.1 hypothetical protein [Kiritimatiellia bacterium]
MSWKRACWIGFAGLFFTAAAQGQIFFAGTQEVGLGGMVDFESTDGTRADLDASYGIYVADYFQVGAECTLKRSGNEKIYGLGITAEYDFDLGIVLFPYVGGHVQVISYDTNGENGGAGVLGVKAGAMVFVAESVALFAELDGDWATSSIYAKDNGTTDLDARIEFGLRYFF